MTAEELPYGNRFGVPFTRDEYVRALQLVMADEHAESLVRTIYDPDPETTSVEIMDGDLFLLASLSEDLARRVVEFRPTLAAEVRLLRLNPDRFREYCRAQREQALREGF